MDIRSAPATDEAASRPGEERTFAAAGAYGGFRIETSFAGCRPALMLDVFWK
jgi:hypothetical protein